MIHEDIFTGIQARRFMMPEIDIVIDGKSCTGCGGCGSVCRYNAVVVSEHMVNGSENYQIEAELNSNCVECLECEEVCLVLDGPRLHEFDNILENFTARSDHKGVQDGGVTTMLLYNLMEQGEIDAAIVTQRDKQWRVIPRIVDTPEGILNAKGSKYVMASTASLLRRAADKYERFAFVGVPCAVQTAKMFREFVSDRLYLNVALYCMESFTHHNLEKLISEKFDFSIGEVQKMDISKGKFMFHTADGVVGNVPIKEIKELRRRCCRKCLDFSGYHSDISIGSVGAPAGWNSVLVKSERGQEAFDKVKGSLELEEGNLKPIINLYERKVRENSKKVGYPFAIRKWG